MAGHAFVGCRHVVRRAERVDRSVGRSDGVASIALPEIRETDPTARQALQQPGLDANAVARELLPEFRSHRELPGIHVARIDLGPRRQPDPAALAGAIAPQLEPGTKAAHAGRERFRWLRGKKSGGGQSLGELAHGRKIDGIAEAEGLAAQGQASRGSAGATYFRCAASRTRLHGRTTPSERTKAMSGAKSSLAMTPSKSGI